MTTTLVHPLHREGPELYPDGVGNDPVKYLTMADIADRIGVKVESIRRTRVRSESRRAAGTSRPGDLPPADEVFGATPVWLETTIEAWERSRPGRGAGGGRPRKKP